MKLIAIEKDGTLQDEMELSEIAREVLHMNCENYEKNGFQKPWCAYFAIVAEKLVGSCAFKSPIRERTVEIAYFTFPGHEGKGYATQMASELLKIAWMNDPGVRVTAQTLPEENASTRILEKLGFTRAKTLNHPEDGIVWEWEIFNPL